MKWYYIFDMQTDECLGEILAFSVADAADCVYVCTSPGFPEF